MIQIDEGRVVMKETGGPTVPFGIAYIEKCRCPTCPVQAKSRCVADKLANFVESTTKKSLIREDIPGVYCSTGTAACTDLDTKQPCQCPTCAVFLQFDLRSATPVNHFCRDGRAG
ncbi:MAG TPA: hypothetical protein VHO84_16255 [Syntrophorhabdaceae bacterium]|nr:hypothetical protein [Syntrophorhabdaceae bacterium]